MGLARMERAKPCDRSDLECRHKQPKPFSTATVSPFLDLIPRYCLPQFAVSSFNCLSSWSLYFTRACEDNGKSAAIRESIVLPR